MTKKPLVKTDAIDKYAKLTIHELEDKIAELQKQIQTTVVKRDLRALRVALAQRKKIVKAKVMTFEETNDHHLLIFDSTDGFQKIAGHSALFYALKICDRIGRRCKIMPDKDNYSRSEEGIVSIRSSDQLVEKMALLDIVPDEELTQDELYFYKMPRVYTEEQIQKLFDFSNQELERIQEIILPKSPMPALYRDILEMNQLVYFNVRDISDRLAKEVLGKELVAQADRVLQSYLNYANIRNQTTWARHELQLGLAKSEAKAIAKTKRAAGQNMMNLLMEIAQLKNRMSNMENLRLMHHRQIGRILSKVVAIEQVAEREYGKMLREEKVLVEKKEQAKATAKG